MSARDHLFCADFVDRGKGGRRIGDCTTILIRSQSSGLRRVNTAEVLEVTDDLVHLFPPIISE